MTLQPEHVSIEDVEYPTSTVPGNEVTVSHTVYGEPVSGLWSNPAIWPDPDHCLPNLTDGGMKIRIDYHVNGEIRAQHRYCWAAGNTDRRASHTVTVPDGEPSLDYFIIVRRQSDLQQVATASVSVPVEGVGNGDDGDDGNGDNDNGDAPNEPPEVSIAGPSSAQAGETVTYEANATDADGTIAGYVWSMPDGSEASGQTADFHYTTAGAYGLSVTVVDDDGSEAMANHVTAVSAADDDDTPDDSEGSGLLLVGTLLAAGYLATRERE